MKSEVKIYHPSEIQVTTGCTKHPAPGEQFCSDHKYYQSPVLLPNQISRKTLDKLNAQQKALNDLQADSLFVVEEILKVEASSVLVKWENYGNPTWEPLVNMPTFIQTLINKKGACKILDHVIRHEKVIDGCKHVLLEWTDEFGEKDVVWQHGDETSATDDFSCQTKKDKDKRLCR